MQFDKFTIKSQESIQRAQQLAVENENQAIESGHLLKGIMDTDDNIMPYLFKRLSVNEQIISSAVDGIINSYPRVSGGQVYLSDAANKALTAARKAAESGGDEYVSLEHLLIGLMNTSGDIASLLKDSGMNTKDIKSAMNELRQGSKVSSQTAEETYNALGKYAINLNESARSGKLDPVIGRDEEIRRVLQILARRTKNNPILVGEPGVRIPAIPDT